jgi:hypothetical protein
MRHDITQQDGEWNAGDLYGSSYAPLEECDDNDQSHRDR